MEIIPEQLLKPRCTSAARILSTGECAWRLEIPAGPPGAYRLAQLDDYATLRRADFRWQPPVYLRLQARASSPLIPGTWGFGLWNNPFGATLFSGFDRFELPALPNAAWFFFASPPNYLSLADDLPAQGGLAATFQSTHLSSIFLVLALFGSPLLIIPSFAQTVRRLGRRWVRQSTVRLDQDPTDWHKYELAWQASTCWFKVDDHLVLETPISPLGPLSLVIWIDNQYAAFPPRQRPRWGTLANPESAWIEVSDVSLRQDSVLF